MIYYSATNSTPMSLLILPFAHRVLHFTWYPTEASLIPRTFHPHRGRHQSAATVIMEKLALTSSLMAKFTEDIRFRKGRVIVRFSEHQDFMTSLEQFEKWLKRTGKALDSSQKQISPLPNEINNQMLKAEVIYVVIRSSLLQLVWLRSLKAFVTHFRIHINMWSTLPDQTQ